MKKLCLGLLIAGAFTSGAAMAQTCTTPGTWTPDAAGTPSVSSDLCAGSDSVALYCEDTDAVVKRAEKAGATIREPAQTFVTGDRFASILDPFGQRWTVMTRVEDVTKEERDRRMAEWAKENA